MRAWRSRLAVRILVAANPWETEPAALHLSPLYCVLSMLLYGVP